MDNLSIYSALSIVPDNAKRTINGGRLNGKTDINPMWRIKSLTEQFGPCGIGWSYEITKQWLEPGADGEVSAFCNILLYVKIDGEWSKGIPGTGGSAFVAKERSGLYTSDECYKMALTDALSVSCKALGVAASVYWDKDTTKYDKRPDTPTEPKEPAHTPQYIDEIKQTVILKELHRTGWDAKGMLTYLAEKFPKDPPDVIGHITEKQFAFIVKALEKKPDKA
jgi:hypothetical protein